MSGSLTRLALSAVSVSAALILLVGCVATAPEISAENVGVGQEAADEQGGESTAVVTPAVVTVEVDGLSFTFTATTCMIYGEEVLISGPGTDEANNIAFLDVDLYSLEPAGGGARIDLGTDSPFSSSDSFYSAYVDPEDDSTVKFDGKSFELTAEFRLNTGEPVGPGTVRTTCV